MMVLFVSQSEKKAIKTTRMVLDAYASRIGDNTWQTVITKEGLDHVRKLLRQSASKNTSVSCHWIRSRHNSELVWIVGNKNKFDENGNVPVNSTNRKILAHYQENSWHFMPVVQSLTALACLLHDLGKASNYFQSKLKNRIYKPDPFRHELVSALLVQGMYFYYSKKGKDLLTELSLGELPAISDILPFCRVKSNSEVLSQYRPFISQSSTVLYSILWLILSHHRLPLPLNQNGDTITNNSFYEGATSLSKLFSYITTGVTYRRYTGLNNSEDEKFIKELEECFNFCFDWTKFSDKWRNDVKKWSTRLLENRSQIEEYAKKGEIKILLKYARLSLMLGDHFYSSQNADAQWNSECPLFANSSKTQGQLKQKLDEHLCGVKNIALKVSHYLPSIEDNFEHTNIIKELKRKSEGRFAWQDKAADTIVKFRQAHSEISGAFILNMAGTGCGKTTANAKIISALSDEIGKLRFTLALGLRSLTLQTGDEYRNRLHLSEDELAVIIGSESVRYLHETNKQNGNDADSFEERPDGAESSDEFYDAETFYEGELPQEGFATVLKNIKAVKMLYAPVVCCTIDHLMGATECCRGGRYMVPFMRLMSSDLVIDEVDDFTGDELNDLKAIGRLIYLCGCLGRKVVLSSATLPPALATGFFYAYRKGLEQFCSLRKKKPNILLGWFSESECMTEVFNSYAPNQINFFNLHKKLTLKQVGILKNIKVSKLGTVWKCSFADNELKRCELSLHEIYCRNMLQAALALHDNHHFLDPKSGKEISIGAIRFANIDPCVAAAKYFCQCSLPENTDIKVMVYHSRQTMLLRNNQEQYLDQILKRNCEDSEYPQFLDDSVIKQHINNSSAKKMLFIVVCSPVEEVGRDHDYDWIVIEPSSWRSIVQMSGRVNRHRLNFVDKPNVMVMQYNYRCFITKDAKDTEGNIKPYYIKPGYEIRNPSMSTHDLDKLLPQGNFVINSADRIVIDDNSQNELAIYEHKVMQEILYNNNPGYASTLNNYPDHYWDLTAITQYLSPFRKSQPSVELTLRKTDLDSDKNFFCIKDNSGGWAKIENIYQIKDASLSDSELSRSRLWIRRNFNLDSEHYADLTGLSVNEVMERFGKLDIPLGGINSHWNYSDIFGMYREDNI